MSISLFTFLGFQFHSLKPLMSIRRAFVELLRLPSEVFGCCKYWFCRGTYVSPSYRTRIHGNPTFQSEYKTSRFSANLAMKGLDSHGKNIQTIVSLSPRPTMCCKLYTCQSLGYTRCESSFHVFITTQSRESCHIKLVIAAFICWRSIIDSIFLCLSCVHK